MALKILYKESPMHSADDGKHSLQFLTEDATNYRNYK